MTDTLAQLRQQWTTPCPTLTEVREHYFPHIKTNRRLRELIQSGQIALTLKKVHDHPRAPHVIYLYDLADYLDSRSKKTA